MVPAQQTYRPDIDGLRAVSILLVLLYHGFPQAVPGGYIGVDVFFVISGYLITSQIYGQAKTGSFSFLSFYARRIRRIFPPLITVLVFVALYGYFRLNLNYFTSLFKHIGAGTVFISNFVLWQESGYFDKKAELKPLLHLWSLAIEEQFYLLWPILIVSFTTKARRYRSALGWILLLVCIASFIAGTHLAGHNSVAAFYSPLSRFWELGIGGLLAVLQLDRAGMPGFAWSRRAKDMVVAAGCISIIACAFLLSKENHFPDLQTALPALSALLIIAAGPDSSVSRRLLASKPMVQLGLISYALYLWHWPLLSFMRIEGAGRGSSTLTWFMLAASVVLAILTRLIVEKPIRSSPARSVPIWLTAVFACIGLVGLLGYKGELRPERLMLQAQIRAQVRAGYPFDLNSVPKKGCAELLAPESLAYRFCNIWGTDDAKHTVVVWGDSTSLAWMPPFAMLVREQGWRVIQFSQAGCPPIVGVHRTDDSYSSKEAYCNAPTLQAQEMEAIRRARPEVVFLIARWNLYYHGHIMDDVLVDNSFITDEPGAASPETARKAFARHLPETINLLSAFSRVVVFKDTPVLKVPVEVGQSTRPGTFEPSAREQARFEAGINQVIDAAVANAPGSVAFDPTARLCDASKCSAYLDGLPAYRDEVHITAFAALRFLPEIQLLGAKR